MTTELEQQNKEENSETQLSTSVLERIEHEKVAPLPRWQFLMVEYGIWVLWGLSVLVGAVAFSVMIFFFMHAGFAFYEATHETVFDMLFEVLPLIWILVFALMALLAHYNLRHTKNGYRYTVLRVLVSSIVFSFVGGLLLHLVGMGFIVDNFIAKQASFFPTLERIETRMWQKPDQGRMLGVYVGEGSSEKTVLVTDNEGVSWEVYTGELNPFELENLYSGKRVHIMGIPSSTTEAYFHGCAVFPWKLDKPASFDEIRKDRDMFIERMNEHHKNLFEELVGTGTIDTFIQKPLCGSHQTVVRIKREVMQ